MSILVPRIHYNVRNHRSHWDNPGNCYHDRYQRVVTRFILMAVICLTMALVWLTVGPMAVFKILITVFLFLLFAPMVLMIIMGALDWLFSWLSGN